MSSYHLYIEKNENLALIQDFSRSNRAKVRVHKKPYVLEKGMVLDIGGTRMYVKGLFPITSKPKICDEYLHLNCGDVSYPYKNIFVGEKGHFNDEEAYEYEEDVKVFKLHLNNQFLVRSERLRNVLGPHCAVGNAGEACSRRSQLLL